MPETEVIQQTEATPTERSYTRSEDGRFTSPPAESKETASTGSPTPVAPAPVVAKVDAPTPVTSTEEVERREYDKLVAKRSKETRTSTESPSPSPSPTTAAPGTPPQQAQASSTAGQSIPSTGQPLENKLPDEYAGVLNLDQYTMLKRVGWLQGAAEMKSMGVEALADTIRAARTYRSELDRQFQQTRQTATEVNQSQIPSAQGQTAPLDVSGHVPAQQGQTALQVRLPDEVEAQLRAVATEYGEDSPVYLAMRHNEAARQLQFQQLYSQRQSDAMALQNAMYSSAEDVAFSVLDKQFPKLKDASERDELRVLARAHGKAMKSVGHAGLSPLEAISFVAKGRYGPDIQAQEKARLAQERQTSLAGSVERGNSTATPARTMDREQREQHIFNELKKGKKREAVLAELSA